MGLVILFKRIATVTKAAVTTIYTCLVSNLLCNVQASFMMLYGLIMLFERIITVTEAAVATSFACLVSNLLCNVQVLFMMLYGLIILFERIVTVTEIAVTTSFACYVSNLLCNVSGFFHDAVWPYHTVRENCNSYRDCCNYVLRLPCLQSALQCSGYFS